MNGLPIEQNWELGGRFGLYTAKLVEEILPERAADLADTMAPVEHSESFLGCTMPWTLSAFTRWGLRRKMARYLRR
jgi:hypothetical protein